MRSFLASQLAALDTANFFARYQFYLVAIIFSTFLASFIGDTKAGIVMTCAAAGSLVALTVMPTIFRHVGTVRLLTTFGILELIVLLLLSVASAPIVIIALSIILSSVAYSIFLGLDILVEASTTNEAETGSVRGIFLTVTNVAAFVASLTLSVILTDGHYFVVFLSAAAILIPFVVLAATSLPKISSVAPAERAHLFETLKSISAIPRALRPILTIHFLLQLYYSWTLFYIPLYLFKYAHLPWHTVSIIMAVSIIPYLIFELPLGWIADRWLGEKEILIGGTVILAFGSIALAWPAEIDPWVWALIFIIGNAGASAIEIMTESNFFKQVDGDDGAAISTLRMLRPLAGIAGPISAALISLYLPGPEAFIAFATILLVAVPIALTIRDSK